MQLQIQMYTQEMALYIRAALWWLPAGITAVSTITTITITIFLVVFLFCVFHIGHWVRLLAFSGVENRVIWGSTKLRNVKSFTQNDLILPICLSSQTFQLGNI